MQTAALFGRPGESMGSACDDGAFCTDADTCSGAGACVGGSPKDCSASSDTCNAGVCNEITNACEPQAINEGGACDDSSVCTLTDVCENGVCQSNLTLPCDDQNVCTDDICDPTTGCDNQIILECVQPVPAASDHGRILLVMGMVSADSAPNSGGGGYSPSVGCLRRNTTIAMASNSATINI